MENVAYYNGKITTIEEMMIPMNDRAVYFGDGVYDVAYVHHGKMFLIDEHIDRFYRSCEMTRIAFPYEREQLKQIFSDLIELLDDRFCDAIIYWQASRGTAPRGHFFPDGVKPNLLAYVKPKKITDIEKPMKLSTCKDIRYTMCNVKTICLMPNILAAQSARDAGCDEAVQIRDNLFTSDGRELHDVVTEGAHTNIHIVKDGKFITAPLENYILPGIARMHCIQLCKEYGIEVEERYIFREELFTADEILVSSTTTLVRSTCELDGVTVGGRNKRFVSELQNRYIEKIKSATADTIAKS